MKIMIISDISKEQINGVSKTLQKTIDVLFSKGHRVLHINADNFKNISFPLYKEIKIALNLWKIIKYINDYNPDYIHIATEGPIGLIAKLYCDHKKYNYTTAIHTNFDIFLKNMYGISSSFILKYMKWFHKNSKTIFVPTLDIKNKFLEKGFKNIIVWSRGVNQTLYHPNKRTKNSNIPVLLYVGRISKEKNIDEFLKLQYIGVKKCIVGDGPYLNELKQIYKNDKTIEFCGVKTGKELATEYANADIFVFPSKSDTFGIVLLEALSSGLLIAAYKEPGPKELVINYYNGYICDNLEKSIDNCLSMYKGDNSLETKIEIKKTIKNYTWEKCTETFLYNLVLK